MGGQGSGRPPSVETLINRQKQEIRTPIGTELFLPNHSGISNNMEAKQAFVPYSGAVANVDLGSKNLTTTGATTTNDLTTSSINKDGSIADVRSIVNFVATIANGGEEGYSANIMNNYARFYHYLTGEPSGYVSISNYALRNRMEVYGDHDAYIGEDEFGEYDTSMSNELVIDRNISISNGVFYEKAIENNAVSVTTTTGDNLGVYQVGASNVVSAYVDNSGGAFTLNSIGDYINVENYLDGSGTATVKGLDVEYIRTNGRAYGIYINNIDGDIASWSIYDISGKNWLQYDNAEHIFGTGQDASIYYDGQDLIINPKKVGTGKLDVLGVLQTDGYRADDGTLGATANVAVAKVGGGTRTLNFRNGLYLGYIDS